jgi:hypothetical protein
MSRNVKLGCDNPLTIRVVNVNKSKKTDPRIVGQVKHKLEAGLKKRNVNLVNVRQDNNDLIISGSVGQADKHTVQNILSLIDGFQYKDIRYENVPSSEQIAPELYGENIAELYETIRSKEKEIIGLRASLSDEKSELGEAKYGLSSLENRVKVLSSAKEHSDTESRQFRTDNARLTTEISELKEQYASNLGAKVKSPMQYMIDIIKENNLDVRSKISDHIKFYIENKVFDRIEDIMSIGNFESKEEFLMSQIEQEGYQKLSSSPLLNISDKNLSDLGVVSLLKDFNNTWKNTEFYTKNISQYEESVEHVSFVDKIKDGHEESVCKVEALPTVSKNATLSEELYKQHTGIIEEFHTKRDAYNSNKTHLEKLASAEELYNVHQDTMSIIETTKGMGLSINYLIGFEVIDEKPTIRVITQGDENDKHLGKIIRQPLEELAKKNNTELLFSEGFTEVRLVQDEYIAKEVNRKSSVIERNINKFVNNNTPSLVDLGFNINITKLSNYNIEAKL